MSFKSKKKYEETDTSGGGDKRRVKLETGLNVIRIVEDNFEHAWVHYFKNSEKKNKRAVCLGKGNCPLCEKGEKAKHRFFFNVIDRKEQKESGETKIKLFEVGKMINEQIKELATDEDYGDPTQYNLKIKRKGEGLKTKYSVMASTKIYDLKDSEKKIIKLATEEGGAYDLDELIKKITKAEILRLMDSEEEEDIDDDKDEDGDEDNKTKKKDKKRTKKVKDEDDGEGEEKEDEEELDIDSELEKLEDEEEEETPKKKKKKVVDEEEEDEDEEPVKKKKKKVVEEEDDEDEENW